VHREVLRHAVVENRFCGDRKTGQLQTQRKQSSLVSRCKQVVSASRESLLDHSWDGQPSLHLYEKWLDEYVD